MTIYTLGYSNKNIGDFIQKIVENNITLVVDVRSIPHSRNPQFNRAYFERHLNSHGLNYLYMGDCLGGIKTNHDFDEAIGEVVRLSEFQNLVLMCVEKDPKNCHRYGTLAPELEKRGKVVEHLLWENNVLSLFSVDKQV